MAMIDTLGPVLQTERLILRLPRISDVPNIQIEIIPSREPSGGLGEIGTAAVAPAIANALWAGSGRRYRSLPLLPGNT